MDTYDETTSLQDLEVSLWRENTRFDRVYMDSILAPNFVEFGRSGKRYNRNTAINVEYEPINAVLPLENFTVTFIRPEVALITYISQTNETEGPRRSNRMSLWDYTKGSWRLVFHQGTPVV